jgi:hypothetical protein
VIPAVTKIETVVVSPRQVTLTLDDEEVRVLQDIFNRIGGSPTASRRGVVDRISRALQKEVGFAKDATDIAADARAIYFEDRG